MVEGAGLSPLRRGVLEHRVLEALTMGERYGHEFGGELGRADGLLTSEGAIHPRLARRRRERSVAARWGIDAFLAVRARPQAA